MQRIAPRGGRVRPGCAAARCRSAAPRWCAARRVRAAFARIARHARSDGSVLRAVPRISGASCAKIHADAAVISPTQTNVA
ncbi:hypothetical protein AK34_546 [Burkholderia dolosa AU0158]|nr:hypothetical protein AK34_546 [Burkholderia dolosa AU0158]VWB37422.1 hypothetical protein BDO18943_01636 [Burkholderia dolosa]